MDDFTSILTHDAGADQDAVFGGDDQDGIFVGFNTAYGAVPARNDVALNESVFGGDGGTDGDRSTGCRNQRFRSNRADLE